MGHGNVVGPTSIKGSLLVDTDIGYKKCMLWTTYHPITSKNMYSPFYMMSKFILADLMLTLNVIIECAISVTISLQQLECIVVAKVLKLNQCRLTISIKATHAMT